MPNKSIFHLLDLIVLFKIDSLVFFFFEVVVLFIVVFNLYLNLKITFFSKSKSNEELCLDLCLDNTT